MRLLEPEQQAAVEEPPVKPRPIIGKTTKEVREVETEVAKGAVVKDPKIEGEDPITVSARAYSTIMGRISILQIENAVRTFHAVNGRYPKDFAEFKEEIIDGYGLRLRTLPYYQEYGYDTKEHKLVILEYPSRKITP